MFVSEVLWSVGTSTILLTYIGDSFMKKVHNLKHNPQHSHFYIWERERERETEIKQQQEQQHTKNSDG